MTTDRRSERTWTGSDCVTYKLLRVLDEDGECDGWELIGIDSGNVRRVAIRLPDCTPRGHEDYSLLRACWALAGTLGGDGADITHIAHMLGGREWDLVRNMIVSRLRDLSGVARTAEAGECEIGGDTVYWWHNNGATGWTSDRPDWWADDKTGEALRFVGRD